MNFRPLTLLESAIVMVVIALGAMGFVISHNMAKTTRMQAIHHELQEYLAAFSTFRLRYHTFPGDFSQAQSVFGKDTLNGNNDRKIAGAEQWSAWQQLSLAGLLDGNPEYSGRISGLKGKVLPGVDVPQSAEAGAGYRAAYQSTAIYGRNGNAVSFAKEDRQHTLNGGALSVTMASALDQKADDGKPGFGLLFALNGDNQGDDCTIREGNFLRYNGEANGLPCRLIMWLEPAK